MEQKHELLFVVMQCRLFISIQWVVDQDWLPIILVAGVVLVFSSDCLGLGLADDGSGLFGTFRRIRRGEQVARVVDHVTLGQAPLKHLGGELVSVAQVCETHNIVPCLAILDDGHGGDDLDTQSLGQEWTLFSIDLAKLGLNMLLG